MFTKLTQPRGRMSNSGSYLRLVLRVDPGSERAFVSHHPRHFPSEIWWDGLHDLGMIDEPWNKKGTHVNCF